MMKLIGFFCLFTWMFLPGEPSLIAEHVEIKLYTYESGGELKASAMPELSAKSPLYPFFRRFDYLLINNSRVHLPEMADRRSEIWSLYPDSVELKKRYLAEFAQDQQLNAYFAETKNFIDNQTAIRTKKYQLEQVLEVASKFFYCNKVLPDTTVQAHVCIGLNGVAEANWTEDYTLLEAFCYEAIFTEITKDKSKLYDEFVLSKRAISDAEKLQYKNQEDFLNQVKLKLFDSMIDSKELLSCLKGHYKVHEKDLAFELKF